MKKIYASLLSILLFVFASSSAIANDGDKVKENILDLYASLSRMDLNGAKKYFLPEGPSEFIGSGGVLFNVTPETFRAGPENGQAPKTIPNAIIAIQHLEVHAGSDMAYATYYQTHYPDGPNSNPIKMQRTTAVWGKRDGRWYCLHVHVSKLGLD